MIEALLIAGWFILGYVLCLVAMRISNHGTTTLGHLFDFVLLCALGPLAIFFVVLVLGDKYGNRDLF